MSSELIGELGQVGLTIGQSPVSNNTAAPVGCTSDESSPERKRQWSVTSSGRPVNRKRFRHAWLMFDIFKDWLRPHPSPELANCIVCNRVIKAGKSELEKHAAGKRHLSMLNGMNAAGGGGASAADGRHTRGHSRHMVILGQDVVEVDSSYDGIMHCIFVYNEKQTPHNT
uniref:Uncharacterized protein n=1 Tax=Rhodnius prolixus TaxID=13249 RepID=T1IFV8_RHOPR